MDGKSKIPARPSHFKQENVQNCLDLILNYSKKCNKLDDFVVNPQSMLKNELKRDFRSKTNQRSPRRTDGNNERVMRSSSSEMITEFVNKYICFENANHSNTIRLNANENIRLKAGGSVLSTDQVNCRIRRRFNPNFTLEEVRPIVTEEIRLTDRRFRNVHDGRVDPKGKSLMPDDLRRSGENPESEKQKPQLKAENPVYQNNATSSETDRKEELGSFLRLRKYFQNDKESDEMNTIYPEDSEEMRRWNEYNNPVRRRNEVFDNENRPGKYVPIGNNSEENPTLDPVDGENVTDPKRTTTEFHNPVRRSNELFDSENRPIKFIDEENRYYQMPDIEDDDNNNNQILFEKNSMNNYESSTDLKGMHQNDNNEIMLNQYENIGEEQVVKDKRTQSDPTHSSEVKQISFAPESETYDYKETDSMQTDSDIGHCHIDNVVDNKKIPKITKCDIKIKRRVDIIEFDTVFKAEIKRRRGLDHLVNKFIVPPDTLNKVQIEGASGARPALVNSAVAGFHEIPLTQDYELMNAVDSFIQADKACKFEEALKAAEIAAKLAPTGCEEEAAAAAVRQFQYQCDRRDEVNSMPLDGRKKPIEIVAYVGSTGQPQKA